MAAANGGQAERPASEASSPTARLLVTLIAPLAVFGARLLPLPGSGIDRAHVPPNATEILAGKLSPIALGLAPYLAAALIVELVAAAVPKFRALRTSGPRGRAKLARAAGLLFVVIAATQAYATSQLLTAVSDHVDVPRVVLTYVAGSAALLILAGFVGRRGLTHGVLAVVASDAVASTIDDAIARHESFGIPPRTVIAAAAVAVCLVTWLAVRRPRAREAIVVAPIAGVWPVRLAAGALGAAATMAAKSGSPLAGFLGRTTGHAAAWIVATVVFTLALAPLLSDVSFVAPLWSRASGKPIADAEAEVKKALSNALPPSLTYLLAMVLIGEAAGALAGEALDLFGLAIATALVLDVASELGARKRLGALISVWSEVRPYAIAPAMRALEEAGIACHVRDERQRALLHILGPFAPSEILVAPTQAADAAEILGDALAPAPSKTSGDAPTSEKKERAATDAKAASGAAFGATAAILVTLLVYRAEPSLPNRLMLGGATDGAPHVSLALALVDDDADPLADAKDPPRGVRIRSESVPVGPGRVEIRHYAVILPTSESGDDVEAMLREAQPFFAKLELPIGDRLVLGPLIEEDDHDHGATTSALRTWLLRGEAPTVTELDVRQALVLPASAASEPSSLGLDLLPEASERFRVLTGRSINRRLAIVIDGRVEAAPAVAGEISGGHLQITPSGSDLAAQTREVERLARGLAPR